MEDGRSLVPYDQNIDPQQRLAYAAARRILSQNNRMTEVKSMFSFDGGDLVVGARHVFVGFKTVFDNAKRLQISSDELLAALSAEFAKPVFIASLSGGDQANELINTIYHTDLILAVVRDRLVKDEVVLISSPNKTIDVLEANTNLNSYEAELLAKLTRDPATMEFVKSWEAGNRRLVSSLQAAGYRTAFLPGASWQRPLTREDRFLGRSQALFLF